MNLGRRFLVLSTLGIVSVLAAGIPAAAQEPIKIGAPYPLTGILAQPGNDLLAGNRYVVDLVNRAGGVMGRKVELVVADTQGNPTTAARAATQLITDDKVVALVGGFGSTPDAAMLSAVQRYGKLFIHQSSGGMKIAQDFGKYDWYFHVYIWDLYRAYAVTELLNSLSPRPKSVVIAHESGLYGTSGSQFTKEWLSRAGYEILDVIPFTAGTPDFTPVIQRTKAKNPDVFFWMGFVGDNLLMAKQAKEQRLNVKLLLNANSGESHAQYSREVAHHITSTNVWSPAMKVLGLPEWVRDIRQAHPSLNVSALVAQGHAGMAILLEAMKQTQSTDQAKLIAWLENPQNTVWTPLGQLGFSPGNRTRDGKEVPGMPEVKHQLILPDDQVIHQYQGDESVVVWPPKTANGKIVYPINR